VGLENAAPDADNRHEVKVRDAHAFALYGKVSSAMDIHLRTAGLEDVAFLADVVMRTTLAQGRFPQDLDLAAYRRGYEEWTRETVLGTIPQCTLSVIEFDGVPIGRLRVLRDGTSMTLAGIQVLPDYQNKRIGTTLLERLKHEADLHRLPLAIAVEKDNPNALRFYQRLGCVIRSEDAEEYHLEYSPQ
jgi:ribosomal protein S18 acetylase RimI-like enzyme